jgi:hypothetical protein
LLGPTQTPPTWDYKQNHKVITNTLNTIRFSGMETAASRLLNTKTPSKRSETGSINQMQGSVWSVSKYPANKTLTLANENLMTVTEPKLITT